MLRPAAVDANGAAKRRVLRRHLASADGAHDAKIGGLVDDVIVQTPARVVDRRVGQAHGSGAVAAGFGRFIHLGDEIATLGRRTVAALHLLAGWILAAQGHAEGAFHRIAFHQEQLALAFPDLDPGVRDEFAGEPPPHIDPHAHASPVVLRFLD